MVLLFGDSVYHRREEIDMDELRLQFCSLKQRSSRIENMAEKFTLMIYQISGIISLVKWGKPPPPHTHTHTKKETNLFCYLCTMGFSVLVK